MTSPIGLDQNKITQLSARLNPLLASYQVFYMNVRGYHWNIQGPHFFELHSKFEEVYTDLLVKIDEVAERILTLGIHTPLHTFKDYSDHSSVDAHENVHEAEDCVKGLVDGFGKIIALQRVIFAEASAADDEGTASQISDYIKEQEKLIWMFQAYLAK